MFVIGKGFSLGWCLPMGIYLTLMFFSGYLLESKFVVNCRNYQTLSVNSILVSKKEYITDHGVASFHTFRIIDPYHE